MSRDVNYRDLPCLDCGKSTCVASDEPADHQRCIGCFIKHTGRTTDDEAAL